MTGLVYKEWRQNRWFILSMIVCSLLQFVYLRSLLSEGQTLAEIAAEMPDMGRKLCLVIAFLAAGEVQTMVLRGDDRKMWGYWITASPDGYRGFLRVKYETVFAMIVLFLTSLSLIDRLFCAVMADKGIPGVADIGGTAVSLAFLQILMRAIDIPFTLRYGNVKGSIIKLIYSVVFIIIISVLILTNFCNFSVMLFEIGEKLFTGDSLSLTASVVLMLSLAAYYLSYRISCRVYLKGVEQYDK